jgi:flavodoxin
MENIRIRYYSKTGNTKAVANYISEKLNIEAKEINSDDYDNPCGLLFLGGAPYANIMSSKLREYAINLKKENVKAVALFTTSNWSRRTVRALKKILKEKDIKVYDEFLYVHMLKIKSSKEKSFMFADEMLKKFEKEL